MEFFKSERFQRAQRTQINHFFPLGRLLLVDDKWMRLVANNYDTIYDVWDTTRYHS